MTKFDGVSGVGSELGAFSPWCQWKILTAEAGFLAAAGARLIFGSKALTVSRTPPVPDSAIRFDCRLVSCILFSHLFLYIEFYYCLLLLLYFFYIKDSFERSYEEKRRKGRGNVKVCIYYLNIYMYI